MCMCTDIESNMELKTHCSYDVTVRLFRVKIFAMEKLQLLHILGELVNLDASYSERTWSV